ncbi:Csu type fimbrial protein [Duganella qianjiadongensis]|uniref:Fimbrial major subunit CsuA/B family protein n=1 Tax=Duganella qianjiadongensis TaxID=2692176 RepID=A0ABW9VMJ6_9BURK|nr:spore coat U domain-containing protein [Duganella qianjiadongensis]MYM40155.1 fimbrial major subunit CsuA/B family protein [Duganella qianjiadongensis]
MNKYKITAIAMIASCISTSALSGSITTNLQSSATISSSCMVSANSVSFGTVTPAASGTVTANSSITAKCSNGLPYNVMVSAGVGGTSTKARAMTGANSSNTDKLSYQVYSDSGYSTRWMDEKGPLILGFTGNGAAQLIPVYGSLSLNQYLIPDTYTDSLTVTLSY